MGIAPLNPSKMSPEVNQQATLEKKQMTETAKKEIAQEFHHRTAHRIEYLHIRCTDAERLFCLKEIIS
jgi:hypothetical protein